MTPTHTDASFDSATLEQLKARVEHYPYYQTARLLYLQALQQHEECSVGDELQRASLFVADRSSLFFLTHADAVTTSPVSQHIEQMQTALREPTAEETSIPAPEKREASHPEALVEPQEPQQAQQAVASAEEVPEPAPQKARRLTAVDAATDYVAYMLQNEQEEAPQPRTATTQTPQTSHTEQLIDNFIEHSSERISLSATPTRLPDIATTDGPQTGDDEDYFTETLSRIYIKQGHYEQAIEIIRKLMLDYPKKNSYFADQIRFLEKLIINNKITK